jgi:hypothetical protein
MGNMQVAELYKKLQTKGVYPEGINETFDGEGTICILIEWGDWKHDHAYLDYLMKGWGYEKTNEITTESDGSDCYSAEHYFVKK